MTLLARVRAGAILALVVGATLPIAATQWVRGRYERAQAVREAPAAAAYLAMVTPLARNSAGYDLPQLLIRARALEELPGFSGRFEVYHATAPLVHATAPPLATATLQRLRREAASSWTGDEALAPLFDRAGWDVVGGVAARPAASAWPLSPVSLALLLVLAVAATWALRAIGASRGAWRPGIGSYVAVAALYGAAVFAGRRATRPIAGWTTRGC